MKAARLITDAELLPPAAADCTAGKIDEHRGRRESETKTVNRPQKRGSSISAVVSALAAVVIKIGVLAKLSPAIYENREDVAAILAALATIITAVSAAGDFGRKWQTNRISRGRVERLLIALSDPEANAGSIREELQDVLKKHDEGIVGPPIK